MRSYVAGRALQAAVRSGGQALAPTDPGGTAERQTDDATRAIAEAIRQGLQIEKTLW